MFKKDPLQIIVFQTYGTRTHLYLRGRALEDEDIDLEKKGILKVFINSWKRFETDEIRYADLILKLPNEQLLRTKADAEGYFLIDQTANDLDALTDEEGWLHFKASYTDSHANRKIQLDNVFKGRMLVPKANSSFGVISDIDDTILHTGVTSFFKWRAVFNTLFVTPRKRKALQGSASLYHRFHRGGNGEEANPIFYVSNSPWNLYRYLEYFLGKNKFPEGPILLRDIRTPFDKTPKPELAHKFHEIYNILKTYPELKFMLIGDCGEKDADIYLQIANEYPDRIAAIYLIDVRHDKKRKRIEALYKDYEHSVFLIVDSEQQFIEHAKSQGFIL